MTLGNYQHVNRGLWIDVTESKRALRFKHVRGRQLAGRDFAEQAIGHGPILTYDVLSELPTYMVAPPAIFSAPWPDRAPRRARGAL